MIQKSKSQTKLLEEGEIDEEEEERVRRSDRLKKKKAFQSLKSNTSNKESSQSQTDSEIIGLLKKLRSEHSGNKLLAESMDIGLEHYKENIKKADKLKKKKEQKQKDKNARIFKRLLRDKNQNNDFEFLKSLIETHKSKLLKRCVK